MALSVDEARAIAKEAYGATHRYTLRFPPGQLPPANMGRSPLPRRFTSSISKRFLVAHTLRPAVEPALGKSSEPLFDQFANAAQLKTRRGSARVAWERQGIQLAARAEWTILYGIAFVLAEARGAEWEVEGAAAGAGGHCTRIAARRIGLGHLFWYGTPGELSKHTQRYKKAPARGLSRAGGGRTLAPAADQG